MFYSFTLRAKVGMGARTMLETFSHLPPPLPSPGKGGLMQK